MIFWNYFIYVNIFTMSEVIQSIPNEKKTYGEQMKLEHKQFLESLPPDQRKEFNIFNESDGLKFSKFLTNKWALTTTHGIPMTYDGKTLTILGISQEANGETAIKIANTVNKIEFETIGWDFTVRFLSNLWTKGEDKPFEIKNGQLLHTGYINDTIIYTNKENILSPTLLEALKNRMNEDRSRIVNQSRHATNAKNEANQLVDNWI